MAKSDTSRSTATVSPNGAADAASWAERHSAAYQTARREIEALEPGDFVLYHEGSLAADILHDAATAGRASAFWDAALEQAKGTLTQRRLESERYQYIYVSDADRTTVTFTVTDLEPVCGAGRLAALAAVEIEVDGVALRLQGVRVIRQRNRVTTEAPKFRDPRTGQWTPASILPQELGQAIAHELHRMLRRELPARSHPGPR